MSMSGVLWNGLRQRCWAGSESDQIGNKISDATFQAIREVLQKKENLDALAMDNIIGGVESARIVSLTIVPPEAPSSVRKELQELKSAIHRLLNAIEHISDHTEWALWRAARLDSTDKDLLDFDSNKGPGYEIFRLKKNIQMMKKAAELAMEKEGSSRGAPPNSIARHLAFHVLTALDQQCVNCTSYDDGTYFNILANVFNDVFPELGGEAFQRYGRWALKNPVIDLESQVIDPSILGTQ